ncbi:MAG: hypothetical protein H0U71_07770 [Gammaproteobacteria bacterium]|nr:hypothetical protein [Gammaproteobacteria bacterium]
MQNIRIALMAGVLYGLAGCSSYKSVEYPAAIPGGYYNAYYNKNAVILYKRPSAKFGCWLAPVGWDCVRR